MNKNKGKLIKSAAVYVFAPLTVTFILLFAFKSGGLFPFGKGSITWCDMSQQVLPLLCDLKDMLTGKSGVFLNLQNAGGMNMWGVIFFFVASPLNLSVLFVDKENMVYLVNILLVVKMSLASLTAVYYFRKCQPKLNGGFVWLLSVCYGLCGYGMIMYQNIIWLDIMYLFPLLVTALHTMFEKKRILPYVLVLTSMMIINYYLGFMIVLYILLFMGIFTFAFRREDKYAGVGGKFVIGSLLSALLSAVVWVPSFSQYLSSGRDGLNSQLEAYDFFQNYQTTSPQLLCNGLLAALLIIGVCSGMKRSRRLNSYLLLCLLTIIPMYIEPVNLMWHMGSYMCFPGRYGFITLFSMAICGGMIFSEMSPEAPALPQEEINAENEHVRISSVPALLVGWICVIAICFFDVFFIKKNFHDITNYTRTLWQNAKSYYLLLEIFAVMLAGFILITILYKKGWLKKTAFVMMAGVLVVAETYGSTKIYVTSPYQHASYKTTDYTKAMELSGKINDDGFYRVKTSSDLFDVNLLGAMGYRSLSHYTSLTSRDYMYMAKLMGYSSYWMEVGSYGGTEVSDALLGIKYHIEDNTLGKDAVYTNENYQIYRQDSAMPLGVVTKSDMSDCTSLQKMTRKQVQETIYSKLISPGDVPITTSYDYTSTDGVDVRQAENGSVSMKLDSEAGYIFYNINIFGKQSLYFDCFDKLSSNLNENINGSFDVYVNGFTLASEYPAQKFNGLLYLGTFENEAVNVKVKVNQNVDCGSYGLFSVNTNRLSKAVQNVKTANLQEESGKITGSITAEKGEKCVIAIPYSQSLKAVVNGQSVKVNKTLEDMVYIDLQEGENTIEITAVPKSFYAGLIISLAGLLLCVLYKLKGNKITLPKGLCKAVNIMVICGGILVILVIYLIPCIAKLVISI